MVDHFPAAVWGLVGVVEPLQDPSSWRESLGFHSKLKSLPVGVFSLLPSVFGSDVWLLRADLSVSHIRVLHMIAQEAWWPQW